MFHALLKQAVQECSIEIIRGRFNGRRCPWGIGEPAFYAYSYRQPNGYPQGDVRPASAYYDEQFGEFILRYEDVLRDPVPDQAVLNFFESTYQIGATLGGWDRARLEFDPSSFR